MPRPSSSAFTLAGVLALAFPPVAWADLRWTVKAIVEIPVERAAR